MDPIFTELRDLVLEAERDPGTDTAEAAIALLRGWLDTHTEDLLAKKGVGEYNGTMMQWFHWYTPADGQHWSRLLSEVPALTALGITGLWLPPANKGIGGANDVGYGTYDLFDLGEFDQKGTVATKYGTKAELMAAIKACHDSGIQVYADAVLNHKMAADFEEDFDAIPFNPSNRYEAMGEARTIRSWTGFNFPARNGLHSGMDWHWWHFDAVDYNSLDPGTKAIWRMKDKDFDGNVDLESGNYDYLMGCDLDINHPEVRVELKHWGEWMLDHVGVDGFRLDAIKHISSDFFGEWVQHLEDHAQRDLFVVGEYWTYNLATLSWYAANTGGKLSLFDAPLHNNFHQASRRGEAFDMRTILDGTLMKEMPLLAVTIVENHDTQPLQALESVVESWFKPLAYAIILLRREGYPCIFHPDYYGAHYIDKGKDGNVHEIWMDSHRSILDKLLLARNQFAYGDQYDYFDHVHRIGWTRLGSVEHPGAMAVLLSAGPAGSRWMEVGKAFTEFRDLTGHRTELITTNEHGWAEFHCLGGSVSVWVEAAGLPQN
ncbi:alpha-amylase [Synechococcus sp. CS-1325]|uniref:alpha-amylase n=1 Tax=unclassified Synechococcus TaxID=2626047 RepID=UPI000DB686E3|nr:MULTISPECIES: alpha-amylase [unclassified Synechococcus]MCT0200519.1 alpha-amylase [Synechococcus sp. CS-1325]MCT0213437.1 alpha-amylase [Synechococcus sp. CS-1326]MCT0232709.1 alpha-amylase [Synechococcus sp. CS-1327]PZU99714.1 MAG: alpha-amylase [Cyanobium sp.]